MPIPSAKSGFIGVYYFEVRIVSKGRDGWMGIGLCGRDANMDRLPGWDSRSYGYHGADGYIFEGSSKGKAYGPTYTTGDYIGCIVNLLNNTVSFTKNGLHLGVAFQSQKIVQQTLYPAVGFRTPGESMEINFGSSGVPFQFDIAEYVFQQQVEIWSKISKVRLPISSETGSRVESSLPAAFAESDMKLRQDRFDETPSLLLHPLITDYLEHEGYHETALLMRQHMADGSGRWNAINEMDVDTINPKETSGNFRKEIRSLIMKGHITLAISSINSNFPAFFDTNRHVLFALKCREFIEAVRRAQVQRDLSEPQSSEGSIIQLGREIVQMFSQDAERSVHVHAALVETFGVLAYENDNLLTKKKEFQGNYDAGKSMVDSKMNSHASLTVDVDADVDMDARNGSPMPDWVQRLFDGSVGDHIASLVDAGLQRQFGVEMAESVLERNLRQAIATARAVRKNGGGVCVGRDVLGRVWTDAPDV
ncbi:Ran-binding protein 10 [Entophlyctis luteolus]|nr:Ran-binding protein 10 [Entophlyctis luteolus]